MQTKSTKKKIKKIGFDLDGVLINKPPFITKSLLEWLVRSHNTTKLSYRYPKHNLERWTRWLSHHPIFRPPLKNNIRIVKKLSREEKCRLYAISSRYKFLEERTKEWFRYHRLNDVFESIYINLNNEQPHLFKERMIKKLKIEVFIDDDLHLIQYLRRRIIGIKVIHASERKKGLKESLLK